VPPRHRTRNPKAGTRRRRPSAPFPGALFAEHGATPEAIDYWRSLWPTLTEQERADTTAGWDDLDRDGFLADVEPSDPVPLESKVPKGPAAQVLGWVTNGGTNRAERARAALAVEKDGPNRKGLTADLERLADA
jgi:hypothetical protein